MMKSKYEKLGIDPGKANVREIFERIIDNNFPNAFVNIVHDSENPGLVFTKHSDGDGSKSIQRILDYCVNRKSEVFQGAVDDAFSMNTGDIAASGFVSGMMAVTQVISVNGFNVPKDEIMRQNALRVAWLLDLYRDYGFQVIFLGGETADLPDQISSMVYDMDVFARTKEENIIRGNVQDGDVIFGFASDGRAVWEDKENSGIMSNGLTLARSCLMNELYAQKYPVCAKGVGSYEGKYSVNDQPHILDGMTVGEAILSPTRQWAICIKLIIDKLKEKNCLHMLHGISMNTGGGATKIANVGKGIIYKKIMPTPSPVFQLIHEQSEEKWRDMYRGFNCGIGIDVVGENHCDFFDTLQEVSIETKIALHRLGKCEVNEGQSNKVILSTYYGEFDDY